MGILQDIETKVEVWIIQKELPKAINAGVAVASGFLMSQKVAPVVAALGIDPNTIIGWLAKFAGTTLVAGISHLISSWLTNKAVVPAVTVQAPPAVPPVGPVKPA
jgi:hypothetical protein